MQTRVPANRHDNKRSTRQLQTGQCTSPWIFEVHRYKYAVYPNLY